MKRAASKRQTEKPAPEKRPEEQKVDTLNPDVGTDEIDNEFREAQRMARGNRTIRRKLMEEVNSDVEPVMAGGDPDVNWVEAGTSGDESVIGGNPSPDYNDVEMIGEAVGLEYEDNEPLHTTEKITDRDKNRWELDPASSEDYKDRVKD
jgi:hypothetical protein